MGELLCQAEDHEVYSGTAVEKLFDPTAHILGEHAREIVKNPGPLAKELALMAALPPPVNILRLIASAYCDRDKFAQFFTHFNKLIQENPQEGAAHLAELAIKFAISGLTTKKEFEDKE